MSKVKLEICPLGVLCEPNSKRGPYVYESPARDLRFFPEVPRDSALYKERFKRRTGVERYFSRAKDGLGRSSYRRRHGLAVMLCMQGVLMHLDARVKRLMSQYDGVLAALSASLPGICLEADGVARSR